MSRIPLVLAAGVVATVAAALFAPALPGARADGEGAAPPAKPAPVVELGAEAPDFTLKDQDGKDVTLSSYRGKKNVVIAFYPKAGTAGCTREMKCFSSEFRKIEDRGAQILAVSGDPVTELRAFATAVGTRFPLLSDQDFAVAKTYGVFTQTMAGGFAGRSAFLVDREGKLRWIQRNYGVPQTLEGNELLAELDKCKVVAADPAEPLASLPSPEKEAKTRLVRYVQALLAEDATAVDGHLHREFGWKPGAAPAMTEQKRKGELDRVRKLFETEDLKALAFADVLDVRQARCLAKGDQEKPGALPGYSQEVKKAVADLAEGDLLVVTFTKQPKTSTGTLFPRELWVFLRKDGTDWKVLNLGGR